MLFQIDDKIISSELFRKKFVCDLNSCKGACCVEGDGGAPLTQDEVTGIKENLTHILPYLSKASKKEIAQNGFYTEDSDGEKHTKLMPEGACVFVSTNSKGINSCAIEQSFRDQKSSHHKPISCHLYPIRVKKFGNLEALNYEEWSICRAACVLGELKQVRVVEFLKDPLIRAYGEDFYTELMSLKHEILKEIDKGS
ncbi:MAG: DUF3109 family protein [Bacteroidetes bacterium]|nr:DUF3109 family protein [Bacteroidota bacterium]